MLHAGLDLSRDTSGLLLARWGGRAASRPLRCRRMAMVCAGSSRGVRARHGPVAVCAAIESMNGARFVHDTLERCGWEVEVADAQKVKGLAPLACKTDRIDAWVLAELSPPRSGSGDLAAGFGLREERERARWRLYLVRKRSSLKHRVHAQLLAFGHACPVSDLFGGRGRELLEAAGLPRAVAGQRARRGQDDRRARRQEIAGIDKELKQLGADHPYVPTLMSVPGIAWVLGYTIAAEIGDINRFASPKKLSRLHRPLPPRLPVRRKRPSRPVDTRRPALPALGADGGNDPRLPTPDLPRPLPAQQAPARQTARRQSRPGRPRPPAGRGDLAHAHPRPTLRSGRRHAGSGRIDGPF